MSRGSVQEVVIMWLLTKIRNCNSDVIHSVSRDSTHEQTEHTLRRRQLHTPYLVETSVVTLEYVSGSSEVAVPDRDPPPNAVQR